jgi:hypothetical protein
VVSTPALELAVLIPLSSKHGFSSLDDAIASSSTSLKKRARNTPSTVTALYGLQAILESFGNKVHDAFAKPPAQCNTPQALALQCLMTSIDSSILNEGGAWLSESEIFEALDLFCNDTNVSSMYNVFKPEGEHWSCVWLWRQLQQVKTSHASSSGGGKVL